MDQVYSVEPISTLTPHPENPRRGDVGAISESIQTNGWYGAVIVQASTRYVLAGNHRLKAAEDQGLSEVPALVIDCDDVTARRILLADNRTNDLAGYDDEALGLVLSSLLEDAGGVDGLAGTGYVVEDVDALLNALEAENASDGGPDLGEGGVNGAHMHHLQWGKQRVPLAEEDVKRLDHLLSGYVEDHGSQYGFLRFLLEEAHGKV